MMLSSSLHKCNNKENILQSCLCLKNTCFITHMRINVLRLAAISWRNKVDYYNGCRTVRSPQLFILHTKTGVRESNKALLCVRHCLVDTTRSPLNGCAEQGASPCSGETRLISDWCWWRLEGPVPETGSSSSGVHRRDLIARRPRYWPKSRRYSDLSSARRRPSKLTARRSVARAPHGSRVSWP